MNKHEFHNYHRIYSIDVPELEHLERNGLLSRYAEFENLRLSKEDLHFFFWISEWISWTNILYCRANKKYWYRPG